MIGADTKRVDAAAKVTGTARYAADVADAGTLHAALVLSTISKGRIRAIDAAAAEAVPGVQLVLTHRNLRRLPENGHIFGGGHSQTKFNPLSSDQVRYHGQIVALVVADTIEAAEHAAHRVRVDYAPEAGARAALEDVMADRKPLPENPTSGPELKAGEPAEAALARAEVRVSAEYETAPQHHNPIELYCTTASWNDGKLTVHIPTQWLMGQRAGLAAVFGVPVEDVRVLSPFVGGGFGGKASMLPHSFLVAEAARMLRRPVKLVVPRQAMFTVGSFRPESHHSLELGAMRDGRLVAYRHDQTTQTSRSDLYPQPGTEISARMYAFPAIECREHFAETDTNTPGFMRAPAEVPAFYALESAMDELAHALNMDPVELRVRNEPERDPVSGKPWSSRKLVECYRRGAELFGWARRDQRPGSMRDGQTGALVGMGCATAAYPNYMMPASARVRIGGDGRAIVFAAAHDIGTGAYTVLGQIAADAIGLRPEQVVVRLGDSDLPPGPVAGGSVTTASVGSAVQEAARQARARLLEAATAQGGVFAGADPAALRIDPAGRVVGPDGSGKTFAEALSRTPAGAEAVAQWGPPGVDPAQVRAGLGGSAMPTGPDLGTHMSFSFGAQFVEVRVDPRTRAIRVARMVGVFDAGTVVNPRTARSQLMGGLVWGLGHGLLEATEVDRRLGRFANTDLGGYHVAACADVRDITVELLPGRDPVANPLGVKGIGEVGIVGINAAVANAVFHATGVRVRRAPAMLEDIMGPGT